MKRTLALVVLALAACRTAPEVTPPVSRPAARVAPPSRRQTEKELEAEIQARAERIASWETGVRAFLADDLATLRACYDVEVKRVEDEAIKGTYRAGESVPHLSGGMLLVLPISPDGSVPAPRLENDTLQNPNVAKCLLSRAKQYRFPPVPEVDEANDIEIPLKFTLMGSAGTN